jgi:DNA-binding NarL/FixJ family response regulator
MDDRAGMLTVLLADPGPLSRGALQVALDNEPDLRVVAAVGDGLQALARAEELQPRVAVLRTDLPPMGHVTLTELLVSHVPGCRVLVLTDADADPPLVLAVLEAGGSGFLTQQSGLADLVEAVRAVDRGEMRVPRRMLEHVFGHLVRARQEDDVLQRIARLTPRERQVLGLLAEGAGNERIAAVLHISPQTARTHIQKVIKKLDVHSRLEAVLLVTRHGLADDLRPDVIVATRTGTPGPPWSVRRSDDPPPAPTVSVTAAEPVTP